MGENTWTLNDSIPASVAQRGVRIRSHHGNGADVRRSDRHGHIVYRITGRIDAVSAPSAAAIQGKIDCFTDEEIDMLMMAFVATINQ